MPADNPPRRITITRAPFDFEHSRTSVTHYSATGEFLVPAKVADYAVGRGYATEGWASDSATRTVKSGPRRRKATTPAKKRTANADAGADTGSDAGMGGTSVDEAYRAVAGQQPADPAS
jgi:hypothetical protein